ncbi:hypothetical protein AAE02nite_50630 [Adhaeribacter aerolatus]|uniref:DUF4890 domain-containing protein n=1 Tax=Adhaeribacter aerolatus TaxID=670289 RepID=A0A512B617_9BACT|nr:hypothetical protein [Adhaeribacter aerolatus]GEO07399.1 hypothetical protein AAE02nite_50630 [Adhaeribacter aerolatus]
MKKIFFVLALTVLGTGAAPANAFISPSFQQGPMGTPQERAEALTKKMNEVLTLTADQSTKIQDINVRRFTEQQSMREKMQAGGDREAMMTQMRALTQKYEAEYKGALTADQYTKYEANRDQFRGGRGGQGSQGGNRPQGQR